MARVAHKAQAAVPVWEPAASAQAVVYSSERLAPEGAGMQRAA